MPEMIKIANLQPGRYVLAVSGGVDSMVLLDLLRQQPGVELVVAHLDHGMRADSKQDLELVRQVTMSHNITFEYKRIYLGAHPSEAIARQMRYTFLQDICKKYNTRSLITAHHLDDLMETAIINLLRGTGRLGLSSLSSNKKTIRPLLTNTKAEIVEYAIKHNLVWREDTTNQDQTYFRNYVRHSIVPRLKPAERKKLVKIIVRQSKINDAIEIQLSDWFAKYVTHEIPAPTLPCYQLIMMPNLAACSLLQFLFKRHIGKTVEAQLASLALHFIKTARVHKRFVLNNNWQMVMLPGSKVIVEARTA